MCHSWRNTPVQEAADGAKREEFSFFLTSALPGHGGAFVSGEGGPRATPLLSRPEKQAPDAPNPRPAASGDTRAGGDTKGAGTECRLSGFPSALTGPFCPHPEPLRWEATLHFGAGACIHRKAEGIAGQNHCLLLILNRIFSKYLGFLFRAGIFPLHRVKRTGDYYCS